MGFGCLGAAGNDGVCGFATILKEGDIDGRSNLLSGKGLALKV
jgi:hypothetical protein